MFPNAINMPINNAVLHNYATMSLCPACCAVFGYDRPSKIRGLDLGIKQPVSAPGIPRGHQSSRCHWQPMLRGHRQAIFWVGRQIRAGALATSMGSSKLAMSKDWKYIGTWSKTMINHEGVGSRFQRRHTRAGIVSKWFRQTNQETHQTPIL